MQLLLPRDGLIGIAVEGLSEKDESHASQEAADVADLTLYYGRDAYFEAADRVEILQSKYSPKQAQKEFRASDAKKTVTKFAQSYRDHLANYGQDATSEKLFFELITNRPIFSGLLAAVEGLTSGSRLTGNALRQANQLKAAAGLPDDMLKEFASKFLLRGMSGSLKDTKGDLRKILVDWSATYDATARARLGDMRNIVRKKAGYDEEHLKVIRQVDVLSALELSDIDDLLPCSENLANVGDVVAREQLPDAIARMSSLTKPLLVHAEGGVGKTVFLEGLASALSNKHEVVFFDCFGGGAYRSPEDGRHLANRGLIHIANLLACRSLCDPILPGSDNPEILFSTFRKRLAQCMNTLATANESRELIIIIDAIDNAADFAKERNQRAFPTQLIESFERSGAVPGVKLVVSCRSHRIERSLGDLSYEDFELRAFSLSETSTYLRSRVTGIKAEETRVAQARSNGNARILEHLVDSDRGLLDVSEIDKPIALDDLLQKRIDDALSEAVRRGYKKKEINAFLAGLSVLPPPVPLSEYAEAHGMAIGAIESFAADLAPLLEQTEHGMTFRDEPTETLVRESYGSQTSALRIVAKNLMERQDKSVYAARSLPGLLQRLGDGKRLFKLAFDERFPAAISSTVGQRRISYARLKAAVVHAAAHSDNNNLVELLVELSSVAASDQKGADFIFDNPDLVVNAQDADALRRLFEMRTKWPGARHARLMIANLLSGAVDDAARHYRNTREWVRHDLQSDNDDYSRPRPERIDHAAVPFHLILQGQPKCALGFMRYWYDWYGFEVSEELYALLSYAINRDPGLKSTLTNFIDEASSAIDCLTGALSFAVLSDKQRYDVIARLGSACKKKSKFKSSGAMTKQRTYDLPDGLRKAAAIAASHGMNEEALAISLRAPHERPRIWTFVDSWSDRGSFPFLFRLSLVAAAKGKCIAERDLLPQELLPHAKGVTRSVSLEELKAIIKRRISTQLRKEWEKDKKEAKRHSRDSLNSESDRFLGYRLPSLLRFTNALAALWTAPRGSADGAFKELLDVWADTRKNKENRYYEHQFNPYFQSLGLTAVLFVLWSRSDLKAVSIRRFIDRIDEQNFKDPSTLIQLVSIINHNRRLDAIAAEQAVAAKALIEREDDVETRSSLYARLARAILPVSTADAQEYFRVGLEQLDSIGSGDYSFTHELLCFAASVKGKQLPEKDFHTLTNICELNMSYEEHKFPWGAFGAALSRTAGVRGLAKLSRWHDREKIDLSYTLLPYLTALLRDQKISPEYALSLNRLADPVELWECNSSTLGKALYAANAANAKLVASEFINQYLDNHPGVSSSSTVKEIAKISKDALGSSNPLTKHLKAAYPTFDAVIRESNEHRNYNPKGDSRLGVMPDESQPEYANIKALVSAIDPLNEDALVAAFEQINLHSPSRDQEREFFDRLRRRVKVKDRTAYIQIIARAEGLDSYAKEKELEHCKAKWSGSSPVIARTFRKIAIPLLEIHAEEFLSFDRLSGYRLRELAELTGVTKQELALELVKVFAAPDWSVPASAWIGLATIIAENADEGHGQAALSRLLNSNAARLTDTVPDGSWQRGLYPADDPLTAATGLVWQSLASPRASERWLATHTIRTFARLECWEVIDALAKKFEDTDSKAFQAPELPFYNLHARLWLLIALARIARDTPKALAKHEAMLRSVALNPRQVHVAMRHFAAQALLACGEAGAIRLTTTDRDKLLSINQSPLPYKTERGNSNGDFYWPRPDDAPKPKHKFSLDYDFDKYEVHGLAGTFSAPGWEVKDLIKEVVHSLDPAITTIYDKGGREIRTGQRAVALPSSTHGYGHYLAWHAIYLAAGQLLKTHQISEYWDYGEPWSEWLESNLLTRSDGLWLSDGMDRAPLDTKQNAMKKGKDGLVITGDRDKLLSLVGIRSRKIADELVVEGDWKSPDGVNIHISSALVPTQKAESRAKELIAEEGFFVWLPTFDYDDQEEHFTNRKEGFQPWIVKPSREGTGLDEYDPLSVIEVERRPHFSPKYAKRFSVTSGDAFKRSLRMPHRKLVARTQAWGYRMPYEEGESTGVRLIAKAPFLGKLLSAFSVDLLILIKLHRYESSKPDYHDGKFTDTVAVLRVKNDLKFDYFKGAVSQVHTSTRW
ncbi:MAG: NACHT domain-containing protein [Marinobacter sp.]